jgi:hypothetical protein
VLPVTLLLLRCAGGEKADVHRRPKTLTRT